ncbi:uncharacterized protein EI90DRAFT_2416277 [Cantharellus anzutake]|uniref:uncharacterized protein n=2 Tax=Cantharellus anzutake TaxID=1750568 RepID=UPI0019043E01|nr:uncharacterized protein EI90DRAFT_2416277 [Cantharellus anzutake]KAF8338800.1 hypothetical protein EI90DRAFT_2416277 [Cantharellus anzutake]
MLPRIIEASSQSKLERLPRVAAEHTYVKSKSKCLPSTRVKIQNSLLNHLKLAENRFVWLRGSPGTGKTAISMSIASTLEKEGTLAASFFWDKNQQGTGLDSLEKFPSTLARQLAVFDADFQVSLVNRLRQPNSELILSLPLESQMRTLVLEPMNGLRGLFSTSKERKFTIILDGLDECGSSEALTSLMNLILLLDELPSAFSILVSCRPERQVISIWGDRGCVIPCDNVDEVDSDETFDTIRQMVKDGLKGCMGESQWEPSTNDLDAFTSACRGLPVMASIRIREVQFQTQSGSDLESEFEYFLNLQAAPQDLNQEYLRIMRRAFRPRLSRIRPHIEKNYREVVGILVAAPVPLSVHGMSHLLGIAEGKIHAILDPLSSIISIPPNNAEVKFYHATAKEFITGVPIGHDEDKVFFIDDSKGYLGLRLLRFVNNVIQRNEIGLPTELPLGDKKNGCFPT